MKKISTFCLTLTSILSSCASNNPTIKHQEDKKYFPLYAEGNASAQKSICPSGMVEIKGDYCPVLEEVCLEWDKNLPDTRCLKFKYPTKCLSDTIPVHYCIDQLPYPYDLNEKPATQMTWYDAKSICESQGKRLCGRREYTQACRGPNNNPYPYGYERDCSKCNCDRTPWLDPKTHTFEELDKRLPIKDILQCKSDYGVVGLVGK